MFPKHLCANGPQETLMLFLDICDIHFIFKGDFKISTEHLSILPMKFIKLFPERKA